MILRYSPRQVALSTVSWLTQLINAPRRMTRFIPLSMPVFARQHFYDKKLKRFFSIEIRDWIDWNTAMQIFYNDDYGLDKLKRQHDIVARYRDIVGAGKIPLIIDCGGNIGLAARYFSDNFPQAQILCVEPDTNNVAQARKNNAANIVFLENAIGSTRSRGTLVDPGLGNNAFRISTTGSADGAGDTDIIAINDLLDRYPAGTYTPFVIKIDIEGFESELFSRNTEWVEKFPLLIMELHDWMLPKTANSGNFLKTIANADRDFVFYGENVFSISNTIL